MHELRVSFSYSYTTARHYYILQNPRNPALYSFERSGLTTTCGCLFGFVCKKKPTKLERFSREESSQRAPPFFCGWWEYRLD